MVLTILVVSLRPLLTFFMKKHFFSLLLLTTIFWNCSVDKRQLEGAWRAVAFYENGQKVITPLDSVSLHFSPVGTYVFRSMGHYYEAGYFKTSLRYIILQDTTEIQMTPDRTIAVQYLSKDTLKLEMGKNGKMQVLFMVR